MYCTCVLSFPIVGVLSFNGLIFSVFSVVLRVFSGIALQASGAAERSGDEAAKRARQRQREGAEKASQLTKEKAASTQRKVVVVIEVLELVGVVDGSCNYEKCGMGCGGGRSASPAMQIKYRQRWAAWVAHKR